MADDKKNIGPEVENPAEATVQGSPGSDPVLTAEEAAILEHEGQATGSHISTPMGDFRKKRRIFRYGSNQKCKDRGRD